MYRKIKKGVIVGRFQPFHKGHLEYLKLAQKKCDFLYIGITTPGKIPTKYEPDNISRLGNQNNPFSFEERSEMISRLLVSEGIPLGSVKFVHFIPEKINDWFRQVDRDVTYYLLLLSDQEKTKVHQMETQGLSVEVLKIKKLKDYSAGEIRRSMSLDNKLWKNMVPKAVCDYFEQNPNLVKRLKNKTI